MEQKKVIYSGEVWDSNIWMNKETFDTFKKLHPGDKVLVFNNGTTLSVEIKSVELYFEHHHKK